MYHYTICNTPDEELFYKQCAALEKNIQGLEKDSLLDDVDGSLTQLYKKEGKEISVHNSEYIGALYVDSEIELTQFFKRWKNRRQTGKRTDRAGEKGECEHLMKSEDLRDWIDSLTQDITFEYLGVNGSICPFSRSDISLCYGEKEQSFDSIDALMHAPFFKGKSLTEICSKVNFE